MLQLGGELLFDLFYSSADEKFRRRSRAHPVVSGIGLVAVGAAAGFATGLLLPARILQPSPVPGVSLVLSPLLTGVLMEGYGRWRVRRGADHSFVATFWGGALFALAMASVRFLLVGR